MTQDNQPETHYFAAEPTSIKNLGFTLQQKPTRQEMQSVMNSLAGYCACLQDNGLASEIQYEYYVSDSNPHARKLSDEFLKSGFSLLENHVLAKLTMNPNKAKSVSDNLEEKFGLRLVFFNQS